METTKDILNYIDEQLAKIEEGKIEIEVEKVKINWVKQRNNVEKNSIDRDRLNLKVREFESNKY